MTSVPASPWRPDGRIALVTGGTRGIGRAVVDELVGLGAEVIAVSRTHVGADDLPAGVVRVEADVASEAGRARIVEAVRGRGRLDVLVHNAGTNVRGPLTGYDDATIAKLIE